MLRHYLAIDTETGGLGLDKQLLEIGAAIFSIDDEDGFAHIGNVFENLPPVSIMIDRRESLRGTATAFKINSYVKRIADRQFGMKDIGNARWLPQMSAVAFLEWSVAASKLYPRPIILGHNTAFDVHHIDNFMSQEGIDEWSGLFCHRKLDTCAIITALREAGHFPALESSSLGKTAELFGFDTSKQHAALFDARLTFKVYRYLLQYLYTLKPANDTAGTSGS